MTDTLIGLLEARRDEECPFGEGWKSRQAGYAEAMDDAIAIIGRHHADQRGEIRLLNQALDPATKYDIADYVVTEDRSKTDVIQDVWDELVKRGLIMWEQTAKDMADMYHDKCKELEALQDSMTKREIGGVVLRKDLDGVCEVFIEVGGKEVKIIRDAHTIIDHWVNWSAVQEQINLIEGQSS